jgi:hypothetical protein
MPAFSDLCVWTVMAAPMIENKNIVKYGFFKYIILA